MQPDNGVLHSQLSGQLCLPARDEPARRADCGEFGSRDTYEVSGVSAQDILVKQTFIEKRLRVCHIRVKGTAYYFRGVPEMEKVQAWVTANFPEKSKVEQRMENKGSKQKKQKK